MSTPPTVQLKLFFARGSDRAVILRQGPYKLSRMILWHRGTDYFEDGQWLKHRVYADRSDLSPDGQHFLYFALDGKPGSPTKGSYTALSRPPYFTALALYPIGHTWWGGGFFLSNDTFVGDGEKDIIGRAEGLSRCTRSWDRTAQREVYTDAKGRAFELPEKTSHHAAARAHPDYLAKGARLYRRRGAELSLIRDFTDMEFTEIRAPYDWRSPGDAGHRPWHPLDGELP
ncbi:MAG: hypothetical protein AAFY38_12570 [Pseudomonadota bacterium]